MSAVFRDFSEDELVHIRHLCLRLAENQHKIERYLNSVPPDEPAS
ncbi:hypothetical protein AB0G35_31220 [Streptomyces sp. NPDC021749]